MSKPHQIRKKAMEFAKKRQWDKAVAEYTRLAEIEANNPNVFNEMGDLHLKTENRSQAFKAFHTAIDAYAAMGLYNNSVAVCKKIIRLNPSDRHVYRKLAGLRGKQGLHQEAVSYAATYLDSVNGETALDGDELKTDLMGLAESLDGVPEVLTRVADCLTARGFVEEGGQVLERLVAAYAAKGQQEQVDKVVEKMDELGYVASEPIPEVVETEFEQHVESADFDADAPGVVDDFGASPAPGEQFDFDSVDLGGSPRMQSATATSTDEVPGNGVSQDDSQGFVTESTFDAGSTSSEPTDPQAAGSPPGSPTDTYDIPSDDPSGSENDDPAVSTNDPAGSMDDDPAVLADDPASPMDDDPAVVAEDPPGSPDGVYDIPAEDPPGSPDGVYDIPAEDPPGSPDNVYDISAEDPPGSSDGVHDIPAEDPPGSSDGVYDIPAEDPPGSDEPATEEDFPRGDSEHADAIRTADASASQTSGEDETPNGPSGPIGDGEVWIPKEEMPGGVDNKKDGDGGVVQMSDLVSHFDAAVKSDVDADDYRSHYDLGMAYIEMDLITEAIREFQFAAKSSMYRARSLELIGLCFIKQRQPRLAIKQLEKGLDLVGDEDRDAIGLHYNLGVAYEMIDDREKAKHCFEEVYMLDVAFRDIVQKIKNYSS